MPITLFRKHAKTMFAKAFLRGAGQAVQYAINKNIFLGGFFAGIFGYSVTLLIFFNISTAYGFSVITPAILAFAGIAAGVGFLIAVDQSKRYWQGKEGEKRTYELLTPILPKDNYLISAFPGEGYDIDFVLVGPSGIYAIEVKNPSVTSRDAKIVFENGYLAIATPGFKRHILLKRPDPIRQVRRNCVSLKKLLAQELHKNYFIKGVVMFPDRFVDDLKGNGVMAFNPERFVSKHLSNATRELESYEVGNILKTLREHTNKVLVQEQSDE